MFLKSKWLSIVIIAGIGWLGLSLIKIKIHQNIVNKEVGSLEEKIYSIEKNNSYIEKFLQNITHPAFLEKEARLKLNFKEAGENVVFVYPDDSTQSSVSVDFKKQLAQMPNYVKWWYYLSGY